MTLSSRNASSKDIRPSPDFGRTSPEKTHKPHDGLEPERQIDVQTSRDHTGAQIINDDLAGIDMSSKLLGEGRDHEFRIRVPLHWTIFFLVIPAMGDALFLVHRRLVEAMHLVGATAHKGESARLATLGCRGFEQRQKFEGQEGVGVVVDLHDSLVAGFAELIVHDVHTAI